ncbi:major tail protein [Mycobacterium phage FF47]|uniref:Major tail subunit n=1 Tax=Mycobacterium phage FF47 TaxID=1305710 RepID=M4W8E9_9CAUD|nr:major tail protein [Mycobacterium phage FF47]AGI12283.1 major tail subunit [Mycobacterium phage FF47]
MTAPVLTSAGRVTEVFAGSPVGINVYGGIYYIPLGEEIPTDAVTPLPAASVHLGFVSEDGVTITTDRSGDPTIAWGGDKIAYLQSSFGISWQFKLMQFFNPDVARLAYGHANVATVAATPTHGNQMVIKQNSQMLDLGIFVIDAFYGKKKVREVAPYARPTELGDTQLVHTELSGVEATLELFPDDSGNSAYRYTDDGEKTGGGGGEGEGEGE